MKSMVDMKEHQVKWSAKSAIGEIELQGIDEMVQELKRIQSFTDSRKGVLASCERRALGRCLQENKVQFTHVAPNPFVPKNEGAYRIYLVDESLERLQIANRILDVWFSHKKYISSMRSKKPWFII